MFCFCEERWKRNCIKFYSVKTFSASYFYNGVVSVLNLIVEASWTWLPSSRHSHCNAIPCTTIGICILWALSQFFLCFNFAFSAFLPLFFFFFPLNNFAIWIKCEGLKCLCACAHEVIDELCCMCLHKRSWLVLEVQNFIIDRGH